jgi:hypothetical protein
MTIVMTIVTIIATTATITITINGATSNQRRRRRSGVADPEKFFDYLDQVIGLERLGEHYVCSRLFGRPKVGICRDRRGLVARHTEVAAPGNCDDADQRERPANRLLVARVALKDHLSAHAGF